MADRKDRTADGLLRDCLGTIRSLQQQVGQMSGMFDDEDGAIAEACDDADEVAEAVRGYLSNKPAHAVDAGVGARRYRVAWYHAVNADTPEQAAEKALVIQCRSNVFEVTEGRHVSTVDLTARVLTGPA